MLFRSYPIIVEHSGWSEHDPLGYWEISMKSNKLLLVNGIVSIIAGILIIYFSLQRSSFEFVDLIVSFIENYIWALLIMLINVFLLILSLSGMSHYSGDSRVKK